MCKNSVVIFLKTDIYVCVFMTIQLRNNINFVVSQIHLSLSTFQHVTHFIFFPSCFKISIPLTLAREHRLLILATS